MNAKTKRIISVVLAIICLALALYLAIKGLLPVDNSGETDPPPSGQTVEQGVFYYEKDEVALYIHTFGELPENYITKSEAKALGWVSSEGNLWKVADGMCIGGDVFSNREGGLPEAAGRVWYECDVAYSGGYRGEQRLLFSNDGLVYYTNDHYATFTQLY